MFKSDEENILEVDSSFENLMHIGLVANNIKVGVIGAGKASLIKTKTFLGAGCKVEVLSPRFDIGFRELKSGYLKLKRGKFCKSFLKDKHIVVIGVSNRKLEKRIIWHCKRLNKLYLVCSDYRLGNLRLGAQKRTDEFVFSLSIRRGNPKLSKYLAQKILSYLQFYSIFSKWVTDLRSKLKHHPQKDQILEFVCSDDFYYFFKKGYANKIIKLFYEDVWDSEVTR
ncbi:precorrin-2 dehydrogenase [Caldicellulosiruptor acetigenus I77R1B]|uniref:precorrin-2 dehydrogenase n=2 Tax=Caldicellulosiruptor TaxID=44000 RepID=E4S6S2_CALA7|nr:NAD(P)-dependent oxidoreductase [Caldicellulosiruptor acetigenus]ADQ40687.1 precorrin-2 dehydrogenase [Caldicellulosiruptor acetigenus I77R1B]WAM35208.1 NAD(P)-dependent oxidoreductase [Caldicellulosiruptor acetigenus]